MLAIFHESGCFSCRRQHRNIIVKGWASLLAHIFKTLAGIWSGPVTLLKSNLFRRLRTSPTLKRTFVILSVVRCWTPGSSSPGWKSSEPNEHFSEQNLANSSAFAWFEAHSSPFSHTTVGVLQPCETPPAFVSHASFVAKFYLYADLFSMFCLLDAITQPFCCVFISTSG